MSDLLRNDGRRQLLRGIILAMRVRSGMIEPLEHAMHAIGA
jgi:hypothetical protein